MSQEKLIPCTQCVSLNERNQPVFCCTFCYESYTKNLRRDCLLCKKSETSEHLAAEFKKYEKLRQEKAECQLCQTLEKLKNKEQEVKELQDKNEKLRMVVEVSAEMGSSGALSEDINNPCRENELRKMYDKLKSQTLAKYMAEIKRRSKADRTIETKEKINTMLQEVFTKAEHDMTKKKEDFLDFFKVSQNKGVKNKKQLQYIDLAVQNLQMIIFHGKPKYYQTMHKELGNSDPDPLCELADDCYWRGCLMALHNPPLILDWKNKQHSDILPPIKIQETNLQI